VRLPIALRRGFHSVAVDADHRRAAAGGGEQGRGERSQDRA